MGNGLQTKRVRAPLYEPGEKNQDYAYGKRGVVSTVAPEPLGNEQGRGGGLWGERVIGRGVSGVGRSADCVPAHTGWHPHRHVDIMRT